MKGLDIYGIWKGLVYGEAMNQSKNQRASIVYFKLKNKVNDVNILFVLILKYFTL